jgi:hypothetical protein
MILLEDNIKLWSEDLEHQKKKEDQIRYNEIRALQTRKTKEKRVVAAREDDVSFIDLL